MTDNAQVNKAWLYAADVVEAFIERSAGIMTTEGIALRRRFVDTVRACNGEGVDALFSSQEIHQLLEEL